MAHKLVFPRKVWSEIEEVVNAVTVETGVRLIGVQESDGFIVKHIIRPGIGAVQKLHNYECDNYYAEQEFDRLLKEDAKLKFIGELHVHPSGFTNLSSTDMN